MRHPNVGRECQQAAGITFTQILSRDVGDRTYSMVGGNLNGDTLTDVVLNTDGVVRAYTAQGSGTLSETWSDPSVGTGSAQILADFDRDGYDDLFSSSFWTGQLYVYLNHPLSGTFQLAWSGALPDEIYSATAADLDGDDNLDLIVGEVRVAYLPRGLSHAAFLFASLAAKLSTIQKVLRDQSFPRAFATLHYCPTQELKSNGVVSPEKN